VRELFLVEDDSVERFLTRWYGPPDRPSSSSAAEPGLPGPLRRWFETTSRWSRPVATQNHVLARPTPADGMRVFWLENQAAWQWAIDSHDPDDDPAVHDRENAAGAAWQATGATLSTFLVHIAVYEAVMGAGCSASACWVTPGQLDEILRPLQPLPMPSWRWPVAGHRLYAGDGLLAFAGPNPEPGETPETAAMHEVWIAADRPGRLAHVAAMADVEWDAIDVG
jgi:hypothetical protein